MIMEEIIQGNKLIARFMGILRIVPDYEIEVEYQLVELKDGGIWHWNELRYHSSWDWLMPVVDKIIKIDITPAPNWSGYRIEIVPRGYVKISGFPMSTITTNVSVEGSLILAVYKAVVEFIQFYNAKKI